MLSKIQISIPSINVSYAMLLTRIQQKQYLHMSNALQENRNFTRCSKCVNETTYNWNDFSYTQKRFGQNKSLSTLRSGLDGVHVRIDIKLQ